MLPIACHVPCRGAQPSRAAHALRADTPVSACLLVSAAFAVAYGLANRLTSARSDIGRGVFDWERAIPFVDWTILPYLSICAFFAASFFVGSDRDALGRHVTRLLLALGLSLMCYAAFPLRFTFERPPTSGALGALFALLSAVDLPYNRAPSLHIGVLVILWARFAPLWGGLRRVALGAWFGLIALSVLTTYQHHVIDLPAGAAVGLLCIALTRRRWLHGPSPRRPAERSRLRRHDDAVPFRQPYSEDLSRPRTQVPRSSTRPSASGRA